MKNILCLGISAVFAVGTLPAFPTALAEDSELYWFGTPDNGYVEDFESYPGWADIDSPDTEWENVTVGGAGTHRTVPDTVDGKGIYGNQAYQLENGRAYFKANQDKVISSGKAYISFSERTRKEDVVSTVSVTDSGADLPTDDHASDYIFQIKNDKADFDLYIGGEKVADLTSNGSVNSNGMSYILDISAVIDLDNGKLTLTAAHNSDTKTIEVDISGTEDVGAIHMATTSINSGLQVDNISVTGFENHIVIPTVAPTEDAGDIQNEFDVLKEKWKTYYGSAEKVV